MCYMNCPFEGYDGTCRHPMQNSLDPDAGCYEGDEVRDDNEELEDEEEPEE